MSFTFANLPGVQVATVDGGLAAVNTPTTQSIMVIGTSAIGPSNSPFQVVSLATAASTFGLNGTLIRGLSEAAAYCDNVSLFRAGTAQGTFTVGATSSGTESFGTTAFAFSNAAGTLYTYGVNLGVDLYTPSAPIPSDVFPGALLTTTGFTDTDFKITSLPIVSVDRLHNRITVAISPAAIPSTVVGALTATGNASITSHVATVTFTQVDTAVFTVGDLINVASATNASLDVASTPVLSAVLSSGVWTITYATAAATLASSAEAAAQLTNLSALTATVNGTGSVAVSANSGFTVTLGQVDSAANTRYSVWYADGVLTLWLDSAIVYSNDPSININTGDSSVSGQPIGGAYVNNGVAGNPDSLSNSLTIAQAISLTPSAPDIAPSYVAPATGIGLTSRQLYIAQQNAMNLLQGFPIDIAVVPGALADNPNVAFYVYGTPTSWVNNPGDSAHPAVPANTNALDWLWTGVDYYGNPVYQWASETLFWDSNNTPHSSWPLQGSSTPVTPVAYNFTSAATRLAQGVGSGNVQQNGFHEVSFAYQLARFCAAQSEAPQVDNGGCLGFIGTSGPASLSNFSLPAVKTWIGYLPTYAVNGAGITYPSVSGSGLLGIPFLVGASSNTLNQACADFANGFRLPGLFATDSGEYDGGPEIDQNGFKIDDGAYLSVQGDYVLQSNGYGTYVGSIAGVVAGLTSSLDQLKAITNKQLAGVSQLYRASLNQLDALTFADVDVLRFQGQGALPVLLHDKTAATTASDYTLALRQRIKFLMIQTLLAEAQNYIGNGTNDGLALTSLKTALDSDCLNLQKRGYISSYLFTITSTPAQQKVGQASIQVSFVPANELVQLNATVGINLNA